MKDRKGQYIFVAVLLLLVATLSICYAVFFDKEDDVKKDDGVKITGVVANETLTLTGATITGTNKGTYDKVSDYTWSVAKADGSDSTGNYTIEVSGTLTIEASTAKVTVTITENSDTVTYDGEEHTIKGYKSMVADSELYDVTTAVRATETAAWTVTKTDAGTYDMGILAADFENIDPNFSDVEFVIVDGQLEISKRKVTLTSADDEKVYDGTALTNDEMTVSGDGFATGEGATYDVTGSQTDKGSSKNTFTYTLNEGTKADNYEITPVEGILTVTAVTDKVTVTITENSDEVTYGGGSHTIKGYASMVADNDLYDVTTAVKATETDAWTVTETNAGTYPMDLKATDFQNTSENFTDVEFVIVDGSLTINPKAVTVTAKSEEFTYDGKAHSNAGYDVDGLVGDDAITAEVTGSITFPSESPVTNKLASYEFTTGTPGNYTVTAKDGKLTMSKAEVAITITAASQEWTYDGAAHTNTAVTVTAGELLTGDTLVATATGSATNVADTKKGNNPIAEGYKIMHIRRRSQ